MLTIGTDAEFILFDTRYNSFVSAREFFSNLFYDESRRKRFENFTNIDCSGMDDWEDVEDSEFFADLRHSEIGLDGDSRLLELRPSPKHFSPKSVSRRFTTLFKELDSLLPENFIVLRIPAGCGCAGAHIHFKGIPLSQTLLNRLDRSLHIPSLLHVPFPLYLRRTWNGWGQCRDYREKEENHFEYRALNNFFSSEQATTRILKRCEEIVKEDEFDPDYHPVLLNTYDLPTIRLLAQKINLFDPRITFFEDTLATFGIRERESEKTIKNRIKKIIPISFNSYDFNLDQITQHISIRSNYPVYLFGLRDRPNMHPHGQLADVRLRGNVLTDKAQVSISASLTNHKFRFDYSNEDETKLKIGLARRIREDPMYAAALIEKILEKIGDLL